MSVNKDEKRGTWYFMVSIDGKQTLRRSKDWTLKRHAVEAEREFLQKMTKLDASKENLTFEEVSIMYMDYIKLHRKMSTVTKTQSVIDKHINSFFGNKKIKSIKSYNVEAFQKELINKIYIRNGKEEYYSNVYLSKVQTQTKLIFDYAVRHQIIIFNPFNKVEIAKRVELQKKTQYTILTKEEYDQFISVVDDITSKTLYSILYWCGLRIGEALALNIKDLDIKNRTMHVFKNYDIRNLQLTTTKTGNDRYVDIPEPCLIDIRELLEYYESNYTINNEYALLGFEKRLTGTTINRHKKQYIEKSGLPHFTFHDLRHTHVSTLIQLGVRPIDISKRLGHSVEMVNNTYGHLFKSDKENIINKLENM